MKAFLKPLQIISLSMVATLLFFTLDTQGQTNVDPDLDDLVFTSSRKSADMSTPAADQKWASLLCKFSDVSSEPQPKSFFKDMFERTSGPSLSSYWNEVTYGNISSLTTDVFGWYTLPGTRASYDFSGSKAGFDYDKLLADCVAAAAGEVDVFSYDYHAVFLNSDNPVAISNIGQSGPVMPSNKFNLATMPHEMGHAFGLPHSKAGSSETTNVYGLMSAHRYNCGAQPDSVYVCVAQHPTAYFKAQLGYIPPEKQYTAAGTEMITLERLALPQTDNYLIAYVSNPDTNEQYTVEARQRVGYDSKLPHDGVIIHKLEDGFFGKVPVLIDEDNNGSFDDEGAIWKPGETFDDGKGVKIAVLASTGSGYDIKITSPGALISGKLSIDTPHPKAGEQLEVTVEVSNTGTKNSTALTVKIQHLNDATFVPGSLQSTAGTVDEAAANVAIPSLTPSQTVSITFSYQVDAGITGAKALSGNVDILDQADSLIENHPMTAIVNPILIHLPTVLR